MKTLTGKPSQVIFAIPFAIFGIFHFLNAEAMSGMLGGFPAAVFLVYFSGAGLIAAAIAIIINKYARLASLLLAAELTIILFATQIPMLSNPEMMQMAMTNILKDTSLIGGALMVAGLLGNNVSESSKSPALS
jgi:uncharacterized membrane protein